MDKSEAASWRELTMMMAAAPGFYIGDS